MGHWVMDTLVDPPVVGYSVMDTLVDSPVVENHRLDIENPQSGFDVISRQIICKGEDTRMDVDPFVCKWMVTRLGFAGGWKPPAGYRKPAERV